MLELLRGRRIRHIALSAVIVIGSLSSLLAFVQPASAAPVSDAPTNATGGTLVETRMVVKGFDAAVAKAHGYHIVTVNGVEASVKDGATTPTPYDYLKGNCGDSWLYMNGGTWEFTYTTGFQNLVLPADWFGWEVVILGPNGYNPDWTWGGPMFGTAWSTGNVRVNVGSTGWYHGVVVPGGSWVILIDGTYCESLGPESGTQVTGQGRRVIRAHQSANLCRGWPTIPSVSSFVPDARTASMPMDRRSFTPHQPSEAHNDAA